jgi:hypothetical protein
MFKFPNVSANLTVNNTGGGEGCGGTSHIDPALGPVSEVKT